MLRNQCVHILYTYQKEEISVSSIYFFNFIGATSAISLYFQRPQTQLTNLGADVSLCLATSMILKHCTLLCDTVHQLLCVVIYLLSAQVDTSKCESS